MKQRKTMKLWQTLVLAGACLGLLINMFLPLWSVNGTKLVDWYMDAADEIVEEDVDIPGIDKSALKNMLDYDGADKQYLLDKATEEFDEGIEKWEEKIGIHIGSLSGIDFITMDVNALLLGDKEYTEEDLERLEKISDKEESNRIEESK